MGLEHAVWLNSLIGLSYSSFVKGSNVTFNLDSYSSTIVLQYIFLYECFERIQEEKQWRHKIMNDRAASGSSGGDGDGSVTK